MRISDWSSDVCSSDLWKVKRSGAIASRARSSAGISVSIVTFELGTICPMRMGLVITPSDRDDRITQRADALDGAFDDVARPHELLRIAARADARGSRTEGRRVGKECGGTGRSWGSPDT